MNNRRKLIAALGAASLAAPFAFAQPQTKVWRIGWLLQGGRPVSLDADYLLIAFRAGMRDLGYVEGKDFVIEPRYGENRIEILPGLAAELVQLNVDFIVCSGTLVMVRVLQKATTTIPIVIGSGADLVRAGLVKSLSHPGGNTTGVSSFTGDIGSKYLELLSGMVPKLSRVAILMNPDNASHPDYMKTFQAASGSMRIVSANARNAVEIDKVFSAMAKDKVGALIVLPDPVLNQQRQQIADLAVKFRIPSMCPYPQYTEAGALMSYGTNIASNYRRAAYYVDKIIKGAKPADLPIEQPTKLELVINGKTAKTLGLTSPQSLLISADKIIE
jgi:putative ABC transport system substrate-binding protein